MNEKEVAELRRRFRPEKSSVNHVRGCYVSPQGEVVSRFDQSLALMPQEEGENLLNQMCIRDREDTMNRLPHGFPMQASLSVL